MHAWEKNEKHHDSPEKWNCCALHIFYCKIITTFSFSFLNENLLGIELKKIELKYPFINVRDKTTVAAANKQVTNRCSFRV